MPEEVRFLGRSSLFGLGLGIVYWIWTQEAAGTILLLAFGVAAGAVAVKFAVDARAAGRDLGRNPLRWLLLDDDRPRSPFLDEPGRLPGPSAAPLLVGLAAALAVLAMAFGPWLLLAAVLPLALGAWSWIADIVAEYRAVERSDRGPEPPGG